MITLAKTVNRVATVLVVFIKPIGLLLSVVVILSFMTLMMHLCPLVQGFR